MDGKPNISILGCGWLGLPLAEKLVSEGFQVKGSTTRQEKLSGMMKEGIQAFQIKLTENGVEGKVLDFLHRSEILIIDIPPGLRQNPESSFIKKINFLIEKIEKTTLKKVLFISSTSVFEDTRSFPCYVESDFPNGSKTNAKQLIEVENKLQDNKFKVSILRFGGLYGGERHPILFLSGRKNVASPNAPVNMIHRKDCIGLIEKIIGAQNWGRVFHGVRPGHPTKKEYYTEAAKQRNLKVPEFSMAKKSRGKIISSAKTQEILKFKYEW